MDQQIRKTLVEDSKEPEDLEKLLEELATQRSEFGYILGKFQIEKQKLLLKSWQKWFQLLGWWFAKLLMYGTLVGAVIFVSILGKDAVNPVTYGLVGAAIYYAIIQIFTPWRLSWETDSIVVEDERVQLQKLIEQNYEEKAD